MKKKTRNNRCIKTRTQAFHKVTINILIYTVSRLDLQLYLKASRMGSNSTVSTKRTFWSKNIFGFRKLKY